MNIMIDMSKAFGAVCKYFHLGNAMECNRLYEALEEAYELTEQPEPRWIPVTERLPKESDGVVLITVSGKVTTGQYSEFSKRWYKGDMCGVGGNDPIAWMPLPKPYERSEDANDQIE